MIEKRNPLAAGLRLRELLQMRSRMSKANGLLFYRPHTKQDWFHRHAEWKFRYMRTGNRFGKSDMGGAEDCAFALGERPWYRKDDPARYAGIPRRSTKGIILCTDWPKAEEIFTSFEEGEGRGKLFKFLPEDSIVKIHRDHGGHVNKISVRNIWDGGVSIIQLDTIVAWKQNEQKSESTAYDWIHVDEPIPKKMFEGFARGLMDRNGKAWFTCTPITEPWINSFFHPNRRVPIKKFEGNFYKDRVMFIGSSADNPHLPVGAMESYADMLDPNVRAARLHGVPIENVGVIYHMFGDEHLYTSPPEGWESMNRPPAHYTVRYHLDCHPQTPHAILFAATAPNGEVYLYDETFEWLTGPELAKNIREKVGMNFCALELTDPSAFIPSMSGKTSLAEDLIEHGIYLEKGAKDPPRGIRAVKEALYRKDYIHVSDDLSWFKNEIDNYVWDDPLKRPDKPKDKDDHMMESFYRLVLAGLDYIDVKQFERSSRPSVNHMLQL